MENNGEMLSNSNGVFNGESARNIGNKILKPIRQEKIVKVPVTQYVEKIIEKEQIKYVNKYVDVIKPIITYKTKHISKPIYLDKIKYETKVIEKEKIIHIPKIEYRNKIVDVPVYVHREKIIEKQIPLIVERVIPILKVRNVEKTVLSENITMPEICEMESVNHSSKSKRNFNVQDYIINSTPNKNSVHEVKYVSEVRKIEENASNMKTYRLNQETSLESDIKVNEQNIVQTKKANFPESNYDRESSYGDSLNGKNETIYAEGIQEDDFVNEDEEEEEREGDEEEEEEEEKREENEEEIKNIKIQEDMQNEKYEANYNSNEGYNQDNSELNSMRINVHLLEPSNEFHASNEQKYSVKCGNNSVVSNSFYENSNNINMNYNAIQNNNASNIFQGSEYNYNEKKEFNEQVMNSNASGAYKLYSSYPMNGNYGANYEHVNRDQIQVEQNYAMSQNDMQAEYENYNQSLQNMHLSRTIINNQSFRPSYANGNGQAMISVRPAVIVESKQKERKPRLSMCNFLNCCGGNQ